MSFSTASRLNIAMLLPGTAKIELYALKCIQLSMYVCICKWEKWNCICVGGEDFAISSKVREKMRGLEEECTDGCRKH